MRIGKLRFAVGLLLLTTTADAQVSIYNARADVTFQSVQQIGLRFLRFYPELGQLPNVLEQLLTDPSVQVDTVIRATDSSRFYLRGYHHQFNPFGLPLDSIRTILSQHIRQTDDQRADTFYLFQIEGIALRPESAEALQTYFRELHNEIKTGFYSAYYNCTKKKQTYLGEGVTYYAVNSPRPAMNLTWQRRNKQMSVVCVSFYVFPPKQSNDAAY